MVFTVEEPFYVPRIRHMILLQISVKRLFIRTKTVLLSLTSLIKLIEYDNFTFSFQGYHYPILDDEDQQCVSFLCCKAWELTEKIWF